MFDICMMFQRLSVRYRTPFGVIMFIIAAILMGLSKYIASAIASGDEEKQDILQTVVVVAGVVIIIISKFVDSAMAID